MSNHSFDVVSHVLSSSLATGGTATVSYPDGRSKGNYNGSGGHKLVANQTVYSAPEDFELTFNANASDITLTWRAAITIASGTTLSIQLEHAGENDADPDALVGIERATFGPLVVLDLGSPIAADTDNMIKAATSTELPNAETVTYTPDTDATSPTDGVGPVVTRGGVDYWEMDVPRNVSVAVTHASSVVAMTVTVTGLDEYGEDVVESISIAATGTSQSGVGKKAFKWVRSIAFVAAGNAEANTANVGFGDVLGLPVFLPGTGYVVKELQDGAAATAGTLVAGVQTKPTATTGDVRGTYDPNAAADGDKGFRLIACLPDPAYKGVDQYAG